MLALRDDAMATRLLLDDLLTEVPVCPDGSYVSLQTPGLPVRGVWGLALLCAVAEKSTHVYFHPWLGDEQLGYVVDGVRYTWEPPPSATKEEMFGVAHSILTGGKPRDGLRTSSKVSSTAEKIIIEGNGTTSDWFAVCWQTDAEGGVEFFHGART